MPVDITYTFSSELDSNYYNKVDILSCTETINLISLFCDTFTHLKPHEDEIQRVLNSNALGRSLYRLHKEEINLRTFSLLIDDNKTWFDFNGDAISKFRKNVTFCALYLGNIENHLKNEGQYQRRTLQVLQKDSLSGKITNLDEFGRHWLRYLINYSSFSSLKVCKFLNKRFPKKVSLAKLNTINYLVNSRLKEYDAYLSILNDIKGDWIQQINKTFGRLFGDTFKNSRVYEDASFALFSVEELELVLFIITASISRLDGYPVDFHENIDDILIDSGVPDVIIQNMIKEAIEFDKLIG